MRIEIYSSSQGQEPPVQHKQRLEHRQFGPHGHVPLDSIIVPEILDILDILDIILEQP
jgi:hypothetical protein